MTPCIDHGRRTKTGYAQKRVDGKPQLVHRLAYCAHHGLSLSDLGTHCVRHTCDNPRCINPEHLVIGTHADNMKDKAVRRRDPRVVLTAEDVAYIRTNCAPSRPGGKQPPNPNSYLALAKRFGVSMGAVRAAYLRITFKHLP